MCDARRACDVHTDYTQMYNHEMGCMGMCIYMCVSVCVSVRVDMRIYRCHLSLRVKVTCVLICMNTYTTYRLITYTTYRLCIPILVCILVV